MPFVLDDEARKGVVIHDRAVSVDRFEPRPPFVFRTRERSRAARYAEVPVAGVHEASNAKHPDNGIASVLYCAHAVQRLAEDPM